VKHLVTIKNRNPKGESDMKQFTFCAF